MDVLLAVLGPNDPWQASALAGTELAGPILAAVQAGSFDQLLVMIQPEDAERAEACRDAILRRGSEVGIAIIPTPPWADGYVHGLDGALHAAGWGGLFHRAGDDGVVSILACPECPAAHSLLMRFAADRLPGYRVLVAVRPDQPSTHPSRLVEVRSAALDERSPPRGGRGVREPAAAYGVRSGAGRGPAADRVDRERERGVEAAERRLRMVADHPSMEVVREIVQAVAPHRVPVLIQGDTGTGKGMVARLIHEAGEAPDQPFVAVNCGALPSTLIESQLFGHCQGSFTGATRDQPGKFVQADGGTLFLDEVGEMPVDLQPKLLRVLEDGVVEPIGATRGKRVDVRVIAATNRDLPRAVADGRFRKDLYYRLAFAVIRMPPLSRRRSDIASLALHFMAQINQSLRSPRQLAPEALRRLEQQPWPGNVRELENVIGRSALLSPGPIIGPDDLVFDDPSGAVEPALPLPEPHPGFRLDAYLAEVRERLALRAMELAGGKQNQAARLLGISPQGINRILLSMDKKERGKPGASTEDGFPS